VSAEFDHHMMGIALNLARQGLGQTAPNPSVGAVLANEATGEVIARGCTAPGGRPHAERIAVDRAASRARGATLYVTLEPCAHHGRTPPCANAVIEAGVSRVVCAIADPDPRVSGRGFAQIKAAGITLENGVRAAEAAFLTRGHLLRVGQRRPFVQLKLALGPDGTVPQGHGGRPVFVTRPESRAFGHLMRARTDAILVGAGTVRADNPDLTCRLPGLSHRSPVRVVLARSAGVLAGTQLAATAQQVPVWLYGGPQAQASVAERAEPGVLVRTMPVVGGQPWLPMVAENLAANGITRLLVEGGPAIWRAFAASGLADEVVVFVASPDFSSETAQRYALAHLGPLPLTLLDRRTIGSDTVCWFTVTSSPGPHSPAPSLI